MMRPISCMYIYYIIFCRKHHVLEEIPDEIIMTKYLISISCIKHIASINSMHMHDCEGHLHSIYMHAMCTDYD